LGGGDTSVTDVKFLVSARGAFALLQLRRAAHLCPERPECKAMVLR
jgi:hypothetical protein